MMKKICVFNDFSLCVVCVIGKLKRDKNSFLIIFIFNYGGEQFFLPRANIIKLDFFLIIVIFLL